MSDVSDPRELARRYLDLWQQHLLQSANLQSANDPELAANLAKLAEMMPGFPGMNWPAPGAADDADKKRPPPAAPPSGNSDNDIVELRRRLANVEKRLDALERRPRGAGKRPTKGSPKRKS